MWASWSRTLELCVTQYEQFQPVCIMYQTTSYNAVHDSKMRQKVATFWVFTPPLSTPTSSFLPSLTLSNLLISQDVEAAILHTYFIQDGYQLPTEPWEGGESVSNKQVLPYCAILSHTVLCHTLP